MITASIVNQAGQRPCLRDRRSANYIGCRQWSVAGGFCLPGAAIAALLLQSLLRGESEVASGTVKWFNGQKGYGFIAPDGGGKDVFVHISAVEKAGLDGLPDGAKVTFDIVPNCGKESAENLRVK
jgi:cold shock protein